MKKLLLFGILAGIILTASSCKKDDENNDPWANTTFEIINKYTIHIDGQNNITRYYVYNNYNTLLYFVRITPINPNLTAIYTFEPDSTLLLEKRFYTNGNTYADSSLQVSYTPTDTAYTPLHYNYNGSGYLTCSTEIINTCTSDIFSYINGNLDHLFNGPPYYTYCDTLAKVDLFSAYRALDNDLTGNNDAKLVKRWDVGPTGPGNSSAYRYYYDLNNDGIVTRQITDRQDITPMTTTHHYTKKTFTYVVE